MPLEIIAPIGLISFFLLFTRTGRKIFGRIALVLAILGGTAFTGIVVYYVAAEFITAL